MNGYQVLGITESDEDFEDGETINDDVQMKTSETDASTSKKTITEESTTSSSDTISQNNDLELISNEGEIKNDNERLRWSGIVGKGRRNQERDNRKHNKE